MPIKFVSHNLSTIVEPKGFVEFRPHLYILWYHFAICLTDVLIYEVLKSHILANREINHLSTRRESCTDIIHPRCGVTAFPHFNSDSVYVPLRFKANAFTDA